MQTSPVNCLLPWGCQNCSFSRQGDLDYISTPLPENTINVALQFNSVQSLSSDSLQPQATRCSTPGLPVHHQLPEFTQTCPLNWWCYPTISSSVVPFCSCPQSFPAPRSFQMSQLSTSGGQSIGVSTSASVLPEYSGLISFRMDWFDLLAFQGTLKSLQHHKSRASILWCSAFFIVQLSHPYMTTGKTIALTRWTFVGKVMSLLFNMLSRLVITSLPRSKQTSF